MDWGDSMYQGLSIFVLVAVLVVLFYLLRAIRMVPQGYNYTVERFGKYIRTLDPGLGIIVPFIDRIGAKQNMMEQVLDIPSQEVITRDNAMVKVDGVTFFQIVDAPRAAYEVRDLNNAIINLVMTNIRTVMGSMELDSLLSQRDEINLRLLNVVDQAAQPWGLKMNRIEIKDIAPPRDLVEAMARQMKAERDKRAAEAEAKATELVSRAIAAGDVQAINYFIANNYIKALEKLATSPNQKVLMLPVEASSVIGSIAGISEIAREAFGGQPPAGQPRRGSVPNTGSGT